MRKSVLALLCSLPALASAEVVDGEDLRDPTRPLFAIVDDGGDGQGEVVAAVPVGEYEVTFVRVSSTPVAIINQQRVTIGDVVGGAEVLAIDRGGVTLSINNQERRVAVYGADITAPAVVQ